MNDKLYKELAKYEIGWWKAHHRRNKPELIHQMAKLYQIQFEIPYENAVEAVNYRVEAAKEHDIAEEFEDKGNQADADIHWDKAEQLMEKHFRNLMKQISSKK